MRERWYKVDWNEVWKKLEMIYFIWEMWLLNFDVEKDVYDRFFSVFEELERDE